MTPGPPPTGPVPEPDPARADDEQDTVATTRGSANVSEGSSDSHGLFGRGLLYVVVMATPLASATIISPILTHVLGPGDFGLVSVAISLNQLLMAVALIGLDQAVLIQRAEDGNNTTSRGLVAVSFVTSAIVMGAMAATAPWWGKAFGLSDSWDIVWLTLVWTAIAAPVAMMITMLLTENRLRAFSVLSLVATTGGQVAALGFVLVGTARPATYIWGSLAATTLALVVGLALTRPRWAGLRETSATTRALRLGLPMTMNAIAGYVLNAGDRILIQRLLGSSEVGRYQVAYTIGYAVVMLMYFVNQSWTPRFASVRSASDRMVLHGTSRDSIYRLLVPTVLGVSLAAPVALRVFAPPSFEPRTLSIVVSLIAVSAFPVAAGGASGRELLTLRRGRAVATSSILAAVLNIALNIALLPRWGILGAAAATLVSFGVQALVKFLALPREPRWPRTSPTLWTAIGVSSVLAVASTLVPDTPVLMGVRFSAAVACLPWLLVEYRRART